MGTPDFAVPSLNALQKYGVQIPCVITQPDRPKGRGRKIISSPVKNAAIELGYFVLQPTNIHDDEFVQTIKRYSPDLFIVIAFGHILPEKVLCIPRIGAINIHASLLPKYRGPAPIQWAIINREKKTGVTSIFMDTGMDTGDILLTKETDVQFDDNSESLHKRLANFGADVLIETLMGLEDKRISPLPQDHTTATYAPMLKKSDGRIDWEKSAIEIEAFVRGMTPWPGAFTFHGKHRLKIFNVKELESECRESAGTVVKGFLNEIRVATGRGVLSILELQSASGKRLKVEDYLKGNSLPIGTVLN